MTTHIEATFLGQHTLYVTKHSYQLEINQRWNGTFVVTATHGYQLKPVAGSVVRYNSLQELLQDWRVLRVIPPEMYA